jgi:type IV pilus assembly protein PilB
MTGYAMSRTEQQSLSPLAAALIEQKILHEAELEAMLAVQAETGQSLLSQLREQNRITAEQLTRLSAAANGIDYVELTPEMVDPVALKLVSMETAKRHTLIPLRIEKDTLVVAMSSPLNLSVREMIMTRTGYRVRPVAASAEAIRREINRHFSVQSMTRQDIVAMRLKNRPAGGQRGRKVRTQAIQAADAPVVRLVESILTGAVDNRASDIHLEPQEPDMRVRYRVDGLLIDALEVPQSAQQEVVSHIKILADMDISEKRRPQDGHITLEHNGREFDLRVSSLPAVGGEKIVIRILDTASGLKRLGDIVDSAEEETQFRKLIANPYGMILLTGPTGCGKTTTLYSLLQELNTAERNIVTVEDPVEYQIRGLTQVQTKPEIGMTFASSLKSILRQDPDVVLIGEIRDVETAEIAISASLTGHLVLSTLHTNNAVGAVSRLVNLGVAPFQAASALLGVVAQRLVRTVCPKCKTSYEAGEQERSFFGADLIADQSRLYRGTGCEHCRGTGYCGRHAVYEIFAVTPEIRRLIVEGACEDRIKETAMKQGMQTLRMQAIRQVLCGRTTADEILRVIDMRED